MNQNNDPSKIIFEGEQSQQPRSFQTTTPKIVQLVIKYSGGYIKGEKRAMYFLLGFVAVAIIVSVFLLFGKEPSSNIPSIPNAGVEGLNSRQ